MSETIWTTRHRLKLSQGELARMIGTDQSTVSNWERGITRPSLESLGKIADALGIARTDLARIALDDLMGDVA